MAKPDFLCIGMQKSGTRWLYEQLREHPDFWMPPLKEIQFFGANFPSDKGVATLTPQRITTPEDAEFNRAIRSMKRSRTHPSSVYTSLFAPAGNRLTGDITPMYATLGDEAIEAVARDFPHLKIVMMLRDPVARAWSALNDAVNIGKLEADAVTDPDCLLKAMKVRHIRLHSSPSAAFLRWSKYFPVHVCFLDDVQTEPQHQIDQIVTFLGGQPRKSEEPGRNTKAGRPRAEFTEPLRDALMSHFRGELRRCSTLFGGPATKWEDEISTTAKLDTELDLLRRDDPNISFGQFYAKTALQAVSAGAEHPTLGGNITNVDDWSQAGVRRFQMFVKLSGIDQSSKVLDYGCGSLRLGQHFIRMLNPGGYVGLDVIPDFYMMGIDLLGRELIEANRPRFGVIGNEADESMAAAHQSDLILASAVAFHVHPDEIGIFQRNILSASRKPGAIVLFDAMLADSEYRYSHRGWTRTLDYYRSLMEGLEFVAEHNSKPIKRIGIPMRMSLLEFRRPR